MRAATAICLASLLVGARSAVGASSSFTDVSGDTAGPDVAAVGVSNDAKELDLAIAFANRTALASGDVVLVDLNLDGREQTGEDGVDLYAAYEGGEEPAAFVWKDGSFAESADATAAYGPAGATLTVPLDLVTGVVGVSVLAVAGPDPDVSPTDRAPDAGRWTYRVDAPALRKGSVRFLPSKPHAGKPFAVGSVTLSFDVVGTLEAKNVACRARLGRTALKQRHACVWTLPKKARGKTLTVSVEARYAGAAYVLPSAKLKVR